MFSSRKKGSIPNGGKLIKTFGARRELALYKIGASGNWLSLKLILVVGTAPKANYRLFWDGERFGKNHDLEILEKHRPAVAADIETYLKENYKSWSSETKAARTSEGVIPENGKHIGDLVDPDGPSEWQVFSVPESTAGNTAVKIIATQRVAGRANYSLEWNGRRFIRDKNFSRIAERVGLLGAAEDFMENREVGEVSSKELDSLKEFY